MLLIIDTINFLFINFPLLSPVLAGERRLKRERQLNSRFFWQRLFFSKDASAHITHTNNNTDTRDLIYLLSRLF